MIHEKDSVKRIDIVSFAVPYPPVYGGAIDVYYRLEALVRIGVEVHLHCFIYGDSRPSKEVETLCKSVNYYQRRRGLLPLLSRQPYIIASRKSGELVEVLSKGSGPILFEGIHTTGIISDQAIAHRAKYIRMHNIEWEYYLYLAQTARQWWKRLHFRRESSKLRQADKLVLPYAKAIFAISDYDREYYSKRHKAVHLIRPFHQFADISVRPGEGEYVLLQGDLRIQDNLSTVLRLARLCQKLDIPCRIAGRSPDKHGRDKLEALKDISLHFDVTDEEMTDLMINAQVQIVDASITSGFKLKLIAALFTARHILARKTLVARRLRGVVHTYSDSSEIETLLKPLMLQPVSNREIEQRKSVLLPEFTNSANALALAKLIGDHEGL